MLEGMPGTIYDSEVALPRLTQKAEIVFAREICFSNLCALNAPANPFPKKALLQTACPKLTEALPQCRHASDLVCWSARMQTWTRRIIFNAHVYTVALRSVFVCSFAACNFAYVYS